VRYDGIYRIEKCWRSKGKQEQLMCRYLFVRCDNEPAPWTADGSFMFGHGRSSGLRFGLASLDCPQSMETCRARCHRWRRSTRLTRCSSSRARARGGGTMIRSPRSGAGRGHRRRARKAQRRCSDGPVMTAALMTPLFQPKKRKLVTEQQRLLKEFGCKLCGKVLNTPLSTPCGHTFCKVRFYTAEG